MKIQKNKLISIIKEEISKVIVEAHGLSKEDAKYIENFIDKTDDKELKRILRFLVKSNVEVDKTQDVTKMKKKEKQ
tara:strand:+ start:273 stop:500 length:228 start_codon:yes stop_codon:yes gene_type:complete